MKIKEAERITGLTAKAIRLYEKEGLLKVSRGDNLYRDYNDETVNELLEIKLYRKLDISISDLKLWKNGEASIEKILSDTVIAYKNEQNDIENKTEICQDILNNLKKSKSIDPDYYLKSFELIEDEEFKNLVEYFEKGSVFSEFFRSLIIIAPIIWLILNYYVLEDYKALAINIPFTIISVVVLTVRWSKFLRVREKSLVNFLKGAVEVLFCVCCFILLIAGVIGIIILVGFLAELSIFGDYLFYRSNGFAIITIFFLEIEYACVFIIITNYFINKKKGKTMDIIRPYLIRKWYLLIIVNIFALYLTLSSLFIVKPDSIINKSLLNPIGKVYEYSDILEINTGIEDGEFFYYIIKMKDGKAFDLIPGGTFYVEADSDYKYAYLIKVDETAVNSGAKKIVYNNDISEIEDENIKFIIEQIFS